jgi:WD40 repeat protein
MDIIDVYNGLIPWSAYIGNQARLNEFEVSVLAESRNPSLEAEPAPSSVKVPVRPRDYSIALQAGLGAAGPELGDVSQVSQHAIELRIENLSGGIDQLNADFNLMLGDLIWKFEISHDMLDNILQEVRLAEFEREARAFRSRAQRSYVNGWYEEALGDFLEAAKRNYPDFAVHRSIASIYLYHLIDLPKALEYFRKAAKYARPSDARQSAEALYFAGMVCVIQRKLEEAAAHLQDAVNLNPELCEAHYQRAGVVALLGDSDAAITSLETAIKGDPRYHERARTDRAFDRMREPVSLLLDGLMQPVQERLAEAKLNLRPKPGYVIAEPEEKKLSALFRDIDQRMAGAKTYKGGLDFLKALSQLQEQLKNIYDLFRKQYQIYLNDYTRSVAFSPDGRLLASGLLSGGIRVWEVSTGLSVLQLAGHLASVNSVAFSPNSRWLASASRDKTVKLWDADTGNEIQTLQAHTGEVRAVAFSPDGNWLASGGHDRTVRMWRVVTGRQVQIIGEHKHYVTSVVFSPNGRWIASASLDKTVRLWEVATGREVGTFRGHASGVESLAFSPDGKLLASGGDDRLIKIWDTSGRQIQTLSGLSSDVTSLAFSPDGRLLAAGSLGRTIKVWRLAAGELIKTLLFTEISYNSVAFSPEGQWLALGSRDVQLWLKVVLTEEEYAAVKDGEQRAVVHEQGSGEPVKNHAR